MGPDHVERDSAIIYANLDADRRKNIYTQRQVEAYRWLMSPEMLLKELSIGELNNYVGTHDDAVVGTVGLLIDGDDCEITRLFMDPARKNLRGGVRLLAHAEGVAAEHDYDSCFIDVAKSCKPQDIFRRNGYAQECFVIRTLVQPDCLVLEEGDNGVAAIKIEQIRLRKSLQRPPAGKP